MPLKHLFIFIIGLNLFRATFALDVDSIEIRLSTIVSDTEKVTEYNNIARKLMSEPVNDYDVALNYLNKGLKIAEQTQNLKGEAELLRTIGIAYFHKKDYDLAISNFQKALEISLQLKDNEGMAQNYYNIAILYREQSKLYYSLNHLLNALSRWKQSGNNEGILSAYIEIIRLYQSIQDYPLAINYVEEALKVAHETGDKAGEASLHDMLARINLAMGNVWDVEDNYAQSLQLYEELNDQLQVARITQNIAANLYLNDPEKRLALLRKSASIYEALDPGNPTLYSIYNNMGNIFMVESRSDSAEFFKKKALDKAILSKSTQTQASAYYSLGRYYLDNHSLNKAGKFFNEAYLLSISAGTTNIQSNALSGLIAVKERQGNFTDAMVELQKYQAVKDSLLRFESERDSSLLNMQYEFEKAEREQNEAIKMELQQQEQAIRQQRYIVYSIITALLFIVILLVFIVRGNQLNKKVNNQLHKQQKEIEEINEELQESHNELSKYKDRLEERVHEQTAKLQQSEIQLRTLSDNLPGGCMYRKHVLANGDESISYISSTAQRWIGVTPEEIKKDIHTFYHRINKEDLEEKIRLEQQSIQTMLPYSCEFRLNKNGKEVWLLENAMPHLDDDGNIVWDGIAVDITDRKEFEAELIRARVQAEESDMLKSSFLANMSHEIRTPMNGIVGFLSFLEQDNLPAAKRQSYIRIIRSNVQQLLQIIEDIIDISKIDTHQLALHPVSFDLNNLMEELDVFFYDIIARNDKKIELILDRRQFRYPCFIQSDPIRVRQILSNLIGNAIKFTLKGYIRFGYLLRKDASELLFFVEDTGIGIPSDKKEYIFERFKQLNDDPLKMYGGTGLGLAISRNLVEMLHGNIWVESEPDIGSVFYFTLPYL
ncbi:MAG: tetratricopeptide repeat protein, partial [Bacteroidales bacterium]|nr:tetratricopeptide repeat protein [Bacteroidales bacterium]